MPIVETADGRIAAMWDLPQLKALYCVVHQKETE
jgi:hypothetical protein